MINIRDIAMEIQNILGDQYRVYAINNAGDFEDIKVGESVEAQMIYHNSKIPVVMQTTPGTIVALRDLFSTSFGFSLEFYIDATQNIDDDLKGLIQALNGQLNIVGDNKFLMTFGTPFPTGQVMVQNGKFKQRIAITGNCAITDKSVFGNEIKITWDDQPLDKMIINGQLSLGMSMTPEVVESTNLIPVSEYESAASVLTLVLHMRKDHPIANKLFMYWLAPNLLLGTSESLEIDAFDHGTNPWKGKILQSDISYSVGGYVIASVTLKCYEEVGE